MGSLKDVVLVFLSDFILPASHFDILDRMLRLLTIFSLFFSPLLYLHDHEPFISCFVSFLVTYTFARPYSTFLFACLSTLVCNLVTHHCYHHSFIVCLPHHYLYPRRLRNHIKFFILFYLHI